MHMTDYDSAIKGNEVLILGMTWMTLEHINAKWKESATEEHNIV